ncbi:MAG: hemerythrin domain-containing protein [Candidatus Eremiobacteraeota bacterium]|nr:hemerythrin domain-containing protein [Candidatus Eremiobacteraeota bacterium]
MNSLNISISLHACRSHHSVLRHLLQEMAAQPANDEAKAIAILQRLRNVLVTHLKLEDDTLYPYLIQSENPMLRDKALRFKAEMGSLAHDFSRFYEAWEPPGHISKERDRFLEESSALRSALLIRMDSEDHDLYEIADRVLRGEAQGAPVNRPGATETEMQ